MRVSVLNTISPLFLCSPAAGWPPSATGGPQQPRRGRRPVPGRPGHGCWRPACVARAGAGCGQPGARSAERSGRAWAGEGRFLPSLRSFFFSTPIVFRASHLHWFFCLSSPQHTAAGAPQHTTTPSWPPQSTMATRCPLPTWPWTTAMVTRWSRPRPSSPSLRPRRRRLLPTRSSSSSRTSRRRRTRASSGMLRLSRARAPAVRRAITSTRWVFFGRQKHVGARARI